MGGREGSSSPVRGRHVGTWGGVIAQGRASGCCVCVVDSWSKNFGGISLSWTSRAIETSQVSCGACGLEFARFLTTHLCASSVLNSSRSPLFRRWNVSVCCLML